MSTPQWLRRFHTPPSASARPLIICPHAGTGASSYRQLSAELNRQFEVSVAQYPGRQDRRREPAALAIADLASGIVGEYVESSGLRDAPLTVFGHSMGAIVAFEVVRAAEAAGAPVELLVASSAVAPSDVSRGPKHPTDDDEILERLLSLNGTAQNLLADREIMAMALPALKADYAAIDRYVCASDALISADILAFGGDIDPIVSPRDLQRWKDHTTAVHETSVFSGGHFYLNGNDKIVAEAVIAAAQARSHL